jgi:periplasmic divalent cation tolerance protein
VKTRKSLFKKLKTAVARHHPYDVPEVIALPVVAGSAPYLKWLADETN